MRLDVTEQVDTAAWNAQVRECGGTVFHTAFWADYVVASQPNASPVFYTLHDDGGEPLGIALGFRHHSSRRLLSGLSGRLAFDALPVTKGNDPKLLQSFIEGIVDDARAHHDVSLAIGSYASPDGTEVLQACGFALTRRLEFEIDLTRSEEEMWRALERKRRKNINKALRRNVTLQEPPPAEAIAHLRRLQAESARRIVERGGRDITFRGNGAGDPLEVLLASGAARIVCACVDGHVESASLFTAFNGLVYHTLSGHSRAALEAQAPTLLLWESIKRYKAEGMTRFNLGGCSIGAVEEGSPEHGVYVYKKAFGGLCRHLASGFKVLRPCAHMFVRFARAVLPR